MNLSSVYTIPAGEPLTANAAYELRAGPAAGTRVWGSTQQALTLSPLLGAGADYRHSPTNTASTAFSASAAFHWSVVIGITCTDGVSGWQGSMAGSVAQTANAILPGTAADNSVALAGATSASYTAAVSSALSVCLQAKWASATGSPTLTCVRTTFRKVA